MLTKAFMDEAIYRYGMARAKLPHFLRQPLGIFLYITGKCNLRCDFCYQRVYNQLGGGWQTATQNELDPQEWIKVVKKLPYGIFLGISGGEATLSGALQPIVESAGRYRPITINTNGSHWREEHYRLFQGPHVKNISISLDGFAGVHDTGRGHIGLFEEIVKNIKKLNKYRGSRGKPSLTIKTVILDENIDSLFAFKDFCEAELKADTLNLSFVKEGDHAQFAMHYCNELTPVLYQTEASLYPYKEPDKVVDVLKKLIRKSRRTSCQVVVYPRMKSGSEIERFLRHKGSQVYRPCFLPWALVVILPNGEVIPCLSFSLGNVRDYDYDISKILAGYNYLRFMEKILKLGVHLTDACNVCCFLKVKDK